MIRLSMVFMVQYGSMMVFSMAHEDRIHDSVHGESRMVNRGSWSKSLIHGGDQLVLQLALRTGAVAQAVADQLG